MHRPLDVHRGDQSRPGDHISPNRLAALRPAEHGGVADTMGWAATTRICRRSSCLITPGKTDQPLYSRLWGSGFLPRAIRASSSGPASDPSCIWTTPTALSRESRAARCSIACASSTALRDGAIRRRRNRRAHRPIRNGVSDADASVPDVMDTSKEPRSRLRPLRPRRRGSRALSPPIACWPAGWPSEA